MESTLNKNIIEMISKDIYWTNLLGLGRSLIASCTLLTLMFNSDETLFIFDNGGQIVGGGVVTNIFIEFGASISRWISYIVLTLVIVGIYPRFTSILHAYITYMFFVTSVLVEGGDQIAVIVTNLLIPILVFDKRKNHWSSDKYSHSFYAKCIAFFSYVLISIQVSYLYFDAVVSKFNTPEWLNGSAVYYWLGDTTFGINSGIFNIIKPLLGNPIFLVTLTWGTLVIELMIAFCIFTNNLRIRKFALVLGVCFHFMIIISFGLVSFFLAITGVLVIALLGKYQNIHFGDLMIMKINQQLKFINWNKFSYKYKKLREDTF